MFQPERRQFRARPRAGLPYPIVAPVADCSLGAWAGGPPSPTTSCCWPWCWYLGNWLVLPGSYCAPKVRRPHGTGRLTPGSGLRLHLRCGAVALRGGGHLPMRHCARFECRRAHPHGGGRPGANHVGRGTGACRRRERWTLIPSSSVLPVHLSGGDAPVAAVHPVPAVHQDQALCGRHRAGLVDRRRPMVVALVALPPSCWSQQHHFGRYTARTEQPDAKPSLPHRTGLLAAGPSVDRDAAGGLSLLGAAICLWRRRNQRNSSWNGSSACPSSVPCFARSVAHRRRPEPTGPHRITGDDRRPGGAHRRPGRAAHGSSRDLLERGSTPRSPGTYRPGLGDTAVLRAGPPVAALAGRPAHHADRDWAVATDVREDISQHEHPSSRIRRLDMIRRRPIEPAGQRRRHQTGDRTMTPSPSSPVCAAWVFPVQAI